MEWTQFIGFHMVWGNFAKEKSYSIVYRFGISPFEANDDVRSKPGTKITKPFSLAISESWNLSFRFKLVYGWLWDDSPVNIVLLITVSLCYEASLKSDVCFLLEKSSFEVQKPSILES